MLDQYFPPREKRKGLYPGNFKEVQRAYRQRSAKNALEAAEVALAKSPDRVKQVTREVMKTNESTAIKDSIDINNRLIGEVLVEMQQLNMLLAQLVRVTAAKDFKENINDAEIGTQTYRSRIEGINVTKEKPYGKVQPFRKRSYDPFAEILGK